MRNDWMVNEKGGLRNPTAAVEHKTIPQTLCYKLFPTARLKTPLERRMVRYMLLCRKGLALYSGGKCNIQSIEVFGILL